MVALPKKLRTFTAAVVFASLACAALAQPAGPFAVHPAPGTTLKHFEKIDDGVYKGSKPKNDADFRFLQSQNIKYIVDLKFFPWIYRIEKNQAKRYGMIVIPATINASPIPPSQKHVNHILCLLADKRLRPIYFHCDVGRDRTSLVATLYELNIRGLPREQAWPTMQKFGFKDGWTLRGLRSYLDHHLHDSAASFSCVPNQSSMP